MVAGLGVPIFRVFYGRYLDPSCKMDLDLLDC